MMPNTDEKINYSLRPQKAIERRLLCQVFAAVNRAFEINKYEYIGMGAKYFADFLLFHREFGFQRMISIEADKEHQEKYEFNKPLKSIKMQYGNTTEVLPSLDWNPSMRSIIWLDYDSELNSNMMEDLETVLSRVASGSLVFMTFISEWFKENPNKRKVFYETSLGDYAPKLDLKSFANLNRHKTQMIPINSVYAHQVSLRKMRYTQLVNFRYKDGCEMTTIGGIVLNESDEEKFHEIDLSGLDFVVTQQDGTQYNLEVPLLTHKEALRLYEQLPCDDLTEVQVPGLSEEAIKQIAKVYRYYPLYIETSLTT